MSALGLIAKLTTAALIAQSEMPAPPPAPPASPDAQETETTVAEPESARCLAKQPVGAPETRAQSLRVGRVLSSSS